MRKKGVLHGESDSSLALHAYQKRHKLLKELRHIIDRLEQECGILPGDVPELLLSTERSVPISIFLSEACPLECIVRYLREMEHESLRNIAGLLNRKYTTVWTTYRKSRAKALLESHHAEEEKVYQRLHIKRGELLLPLSIFSDRDTSILESCVLFLHSTCKLTLHETAVVLNRNDRTIWTAMHRAEEKLSHG